ncbi:MAG: O-antigen ligase family protein [Goleter apudmare HA4340-LM2]|jgi:O-antigen ligase|nr:O-antigen ligase family protein [Goleter apudmare HA4340-LM2]
MLTNNHRDRASRLALIIGIAGIGVGLVGGFIAGAHPLYLGLMLVAVLLVALFFARFEQTVLGLLILRSSLDVFSAQQIPAVFAVGLDVLTVLYVIVQLLTGRTVHTDRYWWFLFAWVCLQGFWVVLLPLGGLGLNASYLLDSIREWIRIFTWVMVYLLIMQMKDKIHPEKVISSLFLALVAPITVALLQIFVPSILPPFLFPSEAASGLGASEGIRIGGTIGHPNGLVTMLLLFMALTYWKLNQSRSRLPWLILLGLQAFCFVSTKALFGLIMLTVFVVVLVAPKLDPIKLIGGILFIVIIIGLFASSDFGRERIASIANTPLLNPNIDISRAILLSQGDYNSFNWRLSQWHFLLNRATEYPYLGYGLGLSIPVAGNGLLPHNDYIRALIEGGIVGLGVYLLFLLGYGIRLTQLIRSAPVGSKQREMCNVMLAFFVSIPVAMITENIWGHTTLFFYWMTLMAVAGWNWNHQHPDRSNLSLNQKLQLSS